MIRGTCLAVDTVTWEDHMAVKAQLDRLAAFEPAPYPVVSLYLNTQPGQTGRDQFHTFVRKEFAARARTYPAGSPERESLDKDLERISRFLDNEIEPAANGVAVFACSAGELFEAVQMSAADRRALALHRRPAPSLSAGAHRIAASDLRDRPRRYERRPHHGLRRGRNGLAGGSHRRQDQAQVAGRLVAGPLPAAHRELPPPAHQGSRRGAREDRSAREHSRDCRRRRRGRAAAAPRADAEAPRSRRWSSTCA